MDIKNKMKITITGATVIRGPGGPDIIYLKTKLPNGVWPFKGTTTLQLSVAADSAEEYMNNNFSEVDYEIVEV